MNELKPCPFCGGKAKTVVIYNGKWRTQCRNNECCASHIRAYTTKDESVEAWNRRAKDEN